MFATTLYTSQIEVMEDSTKEQTNHYHWRREYPTHPNVTVVLNFSLQCALENNWCIAINCLMYITVKLQTATFNLVPRPLPVSITCSYVERPWN